MCTQSHIFICKYGERGQPTGEQFARQLVDGAGGAGWGGVVVKGTSVRKGRRHMEMPKLSTQLCVQCTAAERMSYSDAVHIS